MQFNQQENKILGWQRLCLSKLKCSPALQIIIYLALFLLQIWLGAKVIPLLRTCHLRSSLLIIYQVTLTSVAALLPLPILLKLNNVKASVYGFSSYGCFVEGAIGFVLGFLLVVSIVFALIVTHVYRFKQFSENSSTNLMLAFFIFLAAAIAEETIFRSVIFNTIERRWGTTIALTSTCLLFGFAHMLNDVPLSAKLVGCFCLVFEAGIVLNAAYLIHRRLWLPIGFHWAWNFFEGPIFGMIVSGTHTGTPLIKAELVGSWLETGGRFGPEASLPAILIGTGAGVAMILYARHHGRWLLPSEPIN